MFKNELNTPAQVIRVAEYRNCYLRKVHVLFYAIIRPSSVFTFLTTLAQLEQFLCNTILSYYNHDELIILKSRKISWIFHFIVNRKVFPMCHVLIFWQLIAELTRCSEKILLLAFKQINPYVHVWIGTFWKLSFVNLCLRALNSYLPVAGHIPSNTSSWWFFLIV